MNLIKSTSTYSFFVIISRILGYIRDLFIAIYLGSGPIADAFFVAFRIPNTFRRLFSEGTFNSAFVPSYMSELNKGKKQANKFANNVFNFLILGLLFIVLIIEILMPIFVLLIAPGFIENSEKLEMTINLTRITFPFLLFVSLSSFFGAILNSFNKFAIASAAPIILNIFLILTLLFANYLNDNLVYYLSYAVTAAGVVNLTNAAADTLGDLDTLFGTDPSSGKTGWTVPTNTNTSLTTNLLKGIYSTDTQRTIQGVDSTSTTLPNVFSNLKTKPS